ncbi:MAG: hypothetical protein Q8861_09520 [Bacteroidota bacterium]|nr:hypothetical protein [Bacteroidota bacterium]
MKKLLCIIVLIMISCSCIKAQLHYEKSFEAGVLIGLNEFTKSSYEIDMINGVRLNQSIFAGIGIGARYANSLSGKMRLYNFSSSYYQTSYGSSMNYTTSHDDFDNYGGSLLLPLFLRVKITLSKETVAPFIAGNVGYAFDIGQSYLRNMYGFLVEPSLGMDIYLTKKTALYFMAGYNMQSAQYHNYQTVKDIRGMAVSLSFKGGLKF